MSLQLLLQVGIGRRKNIQLLLIKEDRVAVIKEVSCSDSPVALSVDGLWACVAAGGQYSLYNLETGSMTPLFPYDATTMPLIKRILKVISKGINCINVNLYCKFDMLVLE